MIDRFTIKNKNLYSFCLKASQPVSNWIPTDSEWLVGKCVYLICILAIAILNGLLLFVKEMNIHLLRTIKSFNTLLLFIFLSFGYVLYYRLNTSHNTRFMFLFLIYVVCFILFVVQYSLLMTITEWTDEDTKKKEQSKKTYIKVVGILNITFLLFIILGLDACGYIKKFC